METTEKTFRYSYIFKNLGTFYLMFLVLCVVIGWYVGIREFMFFAIMIGSGVVLVIVFLTSSVSISDLKITTKNLLGTKSLEWSEISQFSSRGSSTRLHNYDGNTILTINSRLDGYTEIFEVLHHKRPDLFDIDRYRSIPHSVLNNVVSIIFGLFLVGLGVLGYVRGRDLTTTLIFGLIFSLFGFVNWYSSPRTITLGKKSLDIGYLRKVISYPIDDIVNITLGEKQHPIKTVFVILQNRNILQLSGYDQTPIVMYYVLKRWCQIYGAEQPSPSA